MPLIWFYTGPVEIAAVGVSIALFNQVSKVAIFPLVSITTSFVAEEETIEKMNIKAIELENQKNATEERTLDDVKLQNMENGSKENSEKNASDAPEDGTYTYASCMPLLWNKLYIMDPCFISQSEALYICYI